MRTFFKYILLVLVFFIGLGQDVLGQDGGCEERQKEFIAIPQQSGDPNEILGPTGFGEENYIAKRNSLSYTLLFENDAEKATAPAQEIILADTLDLSKFNPEDFSFGTFTFRDITVEAIPGVTEFSKDVDMRDRGENIIVRISATFDKVKGIAQWHLIALDPETMDLTESPYLGILYPNTAPPIGEGNVTYRIGLKNDLPHETTITNQAHITFDLNEPIATNVFVNTLDLTKPVSSMSYIPATNDSTFVISWSGTDSGSGIRDYTIYVCKNDGDYAVWQYNTTDTSAEFTGTPGATYRFYCIATDNVGNREEVKPYEIKIDMLPTSIRETLNREIKVYPNPVKQEVFIESAVPVQSYTLMDIMGKNLIKSVSVASSKISIDMHSYAAGVYFVKIETETGCIIKPVIKTD